MESRNDAEPKQGQYSLAQPTISPLFDTRQAQESLLRWANIEDSYYDYLKESWRADIYRDSDVLGFQYFWDKTLQDGVYNLQQDDDTPELISNIDATRASSSISKNYSGSGMEIVLYHKVGLGDGTQANNPWLQEMPDTITKGVWDNYLTVSMADANTLGITSNLDMANKVNLTVGENTVTLPTVIQPGQAKGTVGVALGYGRVASGRVGDGVGVDVNAMKGSLNGHTSLAVTSGVNIEVLPEKYQVARWASPPWS